MCSHKYKIETILNRILILLPGSWPGMGLVGAGGSQKLQHGDLRWPPPHRLRTLVIFCLFGGVEGILGIQLGRVLWEVLLVLSRFHW